MKLPLLFLLLPVLLCAQPQYNFEGETLNFELSRSPADSSALLWSVSGDYYFSNLHSEDLRRLIAFPVPSSDSVGVAKILELSLIEPGDSMRVELLSQWEQGFNFRLDLPRRSFCGVRIRYTQEITGHEARYVLLTANSWGRPLPSCEMRLEVDASIDVAFVPYESLASLGRAGSPRVWSWYIQDFVPDKDFIVRVRGD